MYKVLNSKNEIFGEFNNSTDGFSFIKRLRDLGIDTNGLTVKKE